MPSGDRLISISATGTFGLTAEDRIEQIAAAAAAPAYDRSLHSGTQASSTINDLTETVQDAVAGLLVPGTNVTTTYDDVAGTLTISATGGTTASAEEIRDTIGLALVGTGSVTVTVDDAADTITISSDATVNSSDADLRDRVTHHGLQSAATISDFAEAAQDAVAALLVPGANVEMTYNDVANTLTIASTGGSGGVSDPEAVRDVVGAALVAAGLITVTVNDSADTITIGTTATANATDAALRDRATHTGTQPATSISDLTESVQDIVGGFLQAGANVTATYNDVANTFTVSAATDPEVVRDTIHAALSGSGLITVTHDDVANTMVVTTTATANATDEALRNRTTHTGVQASSTISDLTEAVQDIIGATIVQGSGAEVVYDDAAGTVTITNTVDLARIEDVENSVTVLQQNQAQPIDLDRLPPDAIFKIRWDEVTSAWIHNGVAVTARPSNRADLTMFAIGNTTNKPAFMLDHDVWFKRVVA